MNYYLRYMSFPVIMALSLAAILHGGNALLVVTVLGLFILLIGDALFGDDIEDADPKHVSILNFFMYAHLPLLFLMFIAFLWQLAPGDSLGIGAALENAGFSVMENHLNFSLFHSVLTAILVGVMIGAGGTIVGHELTHRTSDKVAMFFGRWLLAFSNDCSFSIEHVYGHHIRLGTPNDPATARRGENIYKFILRSTLFSYLSAWEIEKTRLDKQGLSIWGPQSKMLRGNLMILSLFVLAYIVAGWVGVGWWLVTSLFGKSLLEFVNFIEHYGLVRNMETTPVLPRHSWNSNKLFSSVWMYNLTRHSDHHSRGDAPFWELKAYPDTLMMPFGYPGTIMLSAIPPLWHRIVNPLVLEWDKNYATKEELALAKQANAESGIDLLIEANKDPIYDK